MKDLNVIFITLDGLRRDRLNLMPNFSSISEKGFFFSNMITVSPSTFISMPAIFSGLYPSKNGINSYYNMFKFRADKCKTLSQYMKEREYYTFADVLNDRVLPKQGFDEMKIHKMGENLIHLHKKIIEDISKKEKFFLYLHYTSIHDSYKENITNNYKVFDKEYFDLKERNKEAYNSYVKQTDEYIGEIIGCIKKLGLFENTLIVFHSDHGTSNGEKIGEKLYGGFLYDYSLKVFSIFLIPEMDGKKIDFQCRTIDIMPTILNIMGFKEDKNFEKIQGNSLIPFFKNEEKKDRMIFCETGGLRGPWPSPRKHNVFCIRYENKKLIYNATPETFEFYNLKEDPDENSNIIYADNDKETLNTIEQYKNLLFEKMKENNIEFSNFQKQNKKGFVLLFSGLSGSGKTTVANMLLDYLNQKKILTFILDGDVVREFFDKNLGFGEEARYESGRRLSFGAHLLSTTGTNVIITCILGTPEIRKSMKDKIDFIEIFMDADIKNCINCDPKGIYKKNMNLKTPDMRGIDLPFEKPIKPELVLYPYKETPEQSFQKVLKFLEEKKLIDQK